MNPYASKRLWIGVAVPIKNQKYHRGTQVITEFDSDHVVVSPVITLESLLHYSIEQVWHVGAQLLLGPSSHSDNPGAREITEISSVDSDSQVTATGDILFKYKEGDPISGVGNLLPMGWLPSSVDPDEIAPLGIRDTEYGNTAVSGGVYDNYRFYCSGTENFEMTQRVYDLLLPQTQYRFGVFYKADFDATGPDFNVSITDGAGEFYTETIRSRAEGNMATWTFHVSHKASAFVPGTEGITSTAVDYCDIKLPLFDNGVGKTRVWLDAPFLAHAQRTSAYLEGLYEFPEYPVLGSLAWNWTTFIQERRLANGELREFDPTGGGGRTKKHTLSCQFENVSADFFDTLNIFLQWQNEGNDLVLITGEQFYGASLPPVVIGRMRLTQVSKASWALGLRSFNFTFTER